MLLGTSSEAVHSTNRFEAVPLRMHGFCTLVRSPGWAPARKAHTGTSLPGERAAGVKRSDIVMLAAAALLRCDRPPQHELPAPSRRGISHVRGGWVQSSVLENQALLVRPAFLQVRHQQSGRPLPNQVGQSRPDPEAQTLPVPSDARLPCDRSPGTGSAETSVSAKLQERVTQNARQPKPALVLRRQ